MTNTPTPLTKCESQVIRKTRNVSLGHRCPHKFMLESELTFTPKYDLDFEFKVIKNTQVRKFTLSTSIHRKLARSGNFGAHNRQTAV